MDQSISKDTDAEPTYLGISEIPFPSQVDQSNESGKRSLDKNEVEPEAKKSATLKKMKTFKDLALNTLKKDGTLKKDLTEKKSATLSKKENTLRRNTIKKSDNASVSNADKRSLPLEKDFANLEKVGINFNCCIYIFRIIRRYQFKMLYKNYRSRIQNMKIILCNISSRSLNFRTNWLYIDNDEYHRKIWFRIFSLWLLTNQNLISDDSV